MRSYPVVNLGSRLGQVKEFEILPDLTIARICGAVKDFNEWKSWSQTPTGDRHMRDAISNVQSMINTVPTSLQKGAVEEIRKYCDNSDDLLGYIQVSLTSTPPAVPPSQAPVASTDREPPPPPPNPYPPVASGQPGPGRNRPWVASRGPGSYPPYMPPMPEEPQAPTGSEAPVVENPQSPQPPPAPAPAPVASVGIGCYYTPGSGYSWGPLTSGGQSTGLSKSDCDAIRQRYNEVASIPNTQPPPPSVTNTQQEHASLYNPNAPASCDPMQGQFQDGHGGCRGSVATGGGNLVNQAMNLGPSGGAGMVTPGNLDNILGSRVGMGRRSYPVVNL